ncbi:unnamed protein product [Acanthosepion pharaonis]|uniref:Uncharacterized protein n=1 Tax=Acanthosepion pharaonis TaxID=158019 RepID=A0A812EF48_ACAPH|nr:unnamed protein product [Sepia pharaonis]
MAQLKYTPPRQSSPAIHVPQQLQDCEFIFVQMTRVKPAFLEKSPRETEPVSTHPEPSPASTTTQSQPSKPRSEPIPESPITPPKQTRLGRKVTFPKNVTAFSCMNRHTYIPETSRQFLTGLGEQEASLFATLTLPVKSTKPSSFSGLTSECHSITTLRGSTQLTPAPPSVPAASSTPAASSSLQLTPAALY